MTYVVDPHMTRHTTKAKNWEHLVEIIRLHNISNLAESSLVLVIRTHKMKTIRLSRVTVTASVVDRQC